MAWKSGANSPLGLPVPGSVDDTELVAVGTIAKFYDDTLGEGEFIYLPGVASVAYGDGVLYDLMPGAEAIVRVTTTNGAGKGRPIAFASAAIVAGKFGWFQIRGVAVVSVAAGYVAGLLYTTATAGVLDDAVVALASIVGALGSSAVGTPVANKAYATLLYPRTQGTVA